MLLMFPICAAGNILTETRFSGNVICIAFEAAAKMCWVSSFIKISFHVVFVAVWTPENQSRYSLGRFEKWIKAGSLNKVCSLCHDKVHVCWIFERKQKKRFVFPSSCVFGATI